MKVEATPNPADKWQDRYLKLRESAEAVLAHSVDMLWELGDLRDSLPAKAKTTLTEYRQALDLLETTLYPHLLARSEREANERRTLGSTD